MKRNNLYPIFLKAERLNFLIVGGGKVALEKITFLLKSSPTANIELVAPDIIYDIEILERKKNVRLHCRKFKSSDLMGKDIVIAATNDRELNRYVYGIAKSQHLLTNVADTPELCDFYLGGIVTKGNLKIAISTNGKSPTMAKRIRQLLEDIIPDETDALLDNLNDYRKDLKMDFEQKVEHLNLLTESFISKN